MIDDETASCCVPIKNYWVFTVMIFLLWLIDLKWVKLFVLCIVN